jgi:hypothetical protein
MVTIMTPLAEHNNQVTTLKVRVTKVQCKNIYFSCPPYNLLAIQGFLNYLAKMIQTMTQSAELNIIQFCYPKGQGYIFSITIDFIKDFK